MSQRVVGGTFNQENFWEDIMESPCFHGQRCSKSKTAFSPSILGGHLALGGGGGGCFPPKNLPKYYGGAITDLVVIPHFRRPVESEQKSITHVNHLLFQRPHYFQWLLNKLRPWFCIFQLAPVRVFIAFIHGQSSTPKLSSILCSSTSI